VFARLSLNRLALPAALIGVQLVMLVLFVVDWRLPLLGMGGFLVATFLLDRPVWTVGAMLAARLISTGTTSFFTIGKVSIGLFEPVLLLALIALGLRAVFTGMKLWRPWPWQPVLLSMMGWYSIGLLWCTKASDGLKDIIGLCVILSTATVILAFTQTWDHVKTLIWFWIGACVLIGV
jgi:hypothetical protein